MAVHVHVPRDLGGPARRPTSQETEARLVAIAPQLWGRRCAQTEGRRPESTSTALYLPHVSADCPVLRGSTGRGLEPRSPLPLPRIPR